MKYDLTKQPKWVQKHIEGLEAKLDLARELLLNASQSTTHSNGHVKCGHNEKYIVLKHDTNELFCIKCNRVVG